MTQPRQSRLVTTWLIAGAVAGLGGQPLIPWSRETPPIVLVPAAQAGVQDKRARFREIFCAVLEARKADLPDYRACDDALTRMAGESTGASAPVPLAPRSAGSSSRGSRGSDTTAWSRG